MKVTTLLNILDFLFYVACCVVFGKYIHNPITRIALFMLIYRGTSNARELRNDSWFWRDKRVSFKSLKLSNRGRHEK